MKIRASNTQDYLFQPEVWEKRFLVGVFNDLVITNTGRTMKLYTQVPEFMVKGRVFNLCMDYPTIIESRTATFASKTDYLNELGLYYNLERNAICKQSELLAASYKKFSFKEGYFVANHIPQVYYPSEFGMIKAIDGEYDFQSQLFKGTMSFFSEEELS